MVPLECQLTSAPKLLMIFSPDDVFLGEVVCSVDGDFKPECHTHPLRTQRGVTDEVAPEIT